MSLTPILKCAALTLCIAAACGKLNAAESQIGYLYPAGGQQGSVIRVTAAGQLLRGAGKVYVSGEGVRGSVIRYIRPLRNLQREQRELLQKRLREVRDKRLAELSGKSAVRSAPEKKAPGRIAADKPGVSKDKNAADAKKVQLPDHPLLFEMDSKSLRELTHVRSIFFFPRTKLQMNRQLAEMVLIEITIDPGAQPGDRELRIETAAGLTNPMVFQVGVFPEIFELEPNNRQAYPALPNLPKWAKVPKEKALDLPVLLNGQIMPGDVDRFRFRAEQGQRLVIEAQARSLIPYLADAVPGWFQATLALYDARGKEVAFADDYRFNPDPVLLYEIPEDGEYELEIRDSIYRGREDFVYRIAVGEQPFITRMFPLGGSAGVKTVASINGWNLPSARLPLDTEPGGDCIRRTAYHKGKKFSNSIPYAVDTLPECNEIERNDTTKDAQQIDLPKIINGRIIRPGDIDVFRFAGRAGDEVVAEVYGRQLNSPLDSLLRLTDASGKVLEWNDDHVLKESHLHKDILGLITHHADSYLLAELPKDGTYYVHLADSQHHGGEAYGYRLRIAVAEGDFALRVTPSGLRVGAGAIVPVCVHALRKDGFDGEIEVVLKGRSAGFKLNGGRIPAGRDRIQMTLTAPPKAPARPVALQLEGRARIGGEVISRPAVSADDVMQAYLYRHLVPTQKLLVSVKKAKWPAPPVALGGGDLVRIPAGGTARVLMKTRITATLKQMHLQLNEPPDGVSLHDVTVVPEGLAFRLKVDENAMPSGFEDNLIVEAFREYTPKQQEGKPAPQKRRYSMGVLPAIPIEIVQQ